VPAFLGKIERAEFAQGFQFQHVATPTIAQHFKLRDCGVLRQRAGRKPRFHAVVNRFGLDMFVAAFFDRLEQVHRIACAALLRIKLRAHQLGVEHHGFRKILRQPRQIRIGRFDATRLERCVRFRDARARLPLRRIAMQNRIGECKRLARAVPVVERRFRHPRQNAAWRLLSNAWPAMSLCAS
jgi:hypothetical protein